MSFKRIANDKFVNILSECERYEILALGQYWRLMKVVNKARTPIGTYETVTEAVEAYNQYKGATDGYQGS